MKVDDLARPFSVAQLNHHGPSTFTHHLLLQTRPPPFNDFLKIGQGEFVAAPAEDAIVVGETVFFEVYNPNPVSGMAFFVKDCTVSDSEGRSHDIISDNCADRATASSYYTDKGMRFILRRQKSCREVP